MPEKRIPTDLEINKCTIVSAAGKSLDFKNAVVEFNYYEDIFSNSSSGVLVLSDSEGRQNQLSWTGDEYLILEFGKPEAKDLEIPPFKGIFRIYTVKGRHLGNDTNENLTINFCSEELFLSERMKISKSYENKPISEIVKDIATNFLKIPESKLLEVEATEGVQDMLVPKLKPLEAINWLSTLAISKELGLGGGATYLFYKDRDGYRFKPLLSIFKNIESDAIQYTNPIAKKSGITNKSSGYWYGMKNVEAPKGDYKPDPYEQIISYQIMNSFDSVETHQRGMFGNRMLSIDYITRTHEIADFNYDTYWEYLQKMKFYSDPYYNNQPIKSLSKDRFGKGHSDYTESTIKIYPSTTRMKDSNYIKEQYARINKQVPANYVENCIPYRFAQLSLLGFNRIKLIIPGDPYITVGKVIYVNFPQTAREASGKAKYDRFFTGYYLISAVRQKLDQENNFETVLELIKDSYTGKKSIVGEKVGLDPYTESDNEVRIKKDTFVW